MHMGPTQIMSSDSTVSDNNNYYYYMYVHAHLKHQHDNWTKSTTSPHASENTTDRLPLILPPLSLLFKYAFTLKTTPQIKYPYIP